MGNLMNLDGAKGSTYELDKEIRTGDVWVDGKLIYQKIFQKTNVAINKSTKIPHGITDIDNVINYKVYLTDIRNGLVSMSFPTHSSGKTLMAIVKQLNFEFLGEDYYEAYDGRTVTFIIRYTKSGGGN